MIIVKLDDGLSESCIPLIMQMYVLRSCKHKILLHYQIIWFDQQLTNLSI